MRASQRRLPNDFESRLESLYEPALYREVLKTFVRRPTTFRVNTLKSSVQEILPQLAQEGFKVQRVPWLREAFILANRSQREFERGSWYEEGKVYLQSLASMVPPLVLAPQSGERVLDLTAAPGSKSSQIAAMMGNNGELVANDAHPLRAERLRHNLKLLGVSSAFATVTVEDGTQLCARYQGYFDRVLLDAPCSGEARFVLQDPATYAHWSERRVRECAALQRKLLEAAWAALKPGGLLVYSTCTFAPEENEGAVAALLHATNAIPVRVQGGLLKEAPVIRSWRGEAWPETVSGALRLLPTREVEGFFIAAFRKPTSATTGEENNVSKTDQ